MVTKKGFAACVAALACTPALVAQDDVRIKIHEDVDGLNEFTGAIGASMEGFVGVDGLGDLLVGAPSDGSGAGKLGNGRVYVIDGTTGAVLSRLTSPTNPGFGAAEYGTSVSIVPDVDGDGRDDFVVSAPEHDAITPNTSGQVYIYAQPATPGVTPALLSTWEEPSPVVGQLREFGDKVLGIEDVDGDGAGDVVVSAEPWNTTGADIAGRVLVMSGATGALIHEFVDPTVTTSTVFFDHFFGASLMRTPDVDGDGGPDVGVSDSDGVHFFNPATGALIHSISINVLDESPAIAWIDDINDNGFLEVLVAAPDGGSGRVFVQDGLTGATLATLGSPQPMNGLGYGWHVEAGGDIDGDGVRDFAIGSPRRENPGAARGRVFVFSGADLSWITIAYPDDTDDGSTGPVSSFGDFIAFVPDANGDGVDDYAVASPFDSAGATPQAKSSLYVLFCDDEIEAATASRVGSPANPVALSATTDPELGEAWELDLDGAALVPGPTLEFLLVSAGQANVPSPKGTLLVDTAVPPLLITLPPSPAPLSFTLPGDCALAGIDITLQAAATNGSINRLGNALDATLGTYGG